MNRIIATLAALALVLVSAGAALADHSKPMRGVVKSVDPVKHVVTFGDGTRFTAGPGVEVDGLEPGERVIFWWHDWGQGKVVVSDELGWGGDSRVSAF
jgi:hypothetical protein